MAIESMIRDVFGHFQNLNLLALLHDLDQGRMARQAWASGSLLCPVAHGLPAGQQVRQLALLGHATSPPATSAPTRERSSVLCVRGTRTRSAVPGCSINSTSYGRSG